MPKYMAIIVFMLCSVMFFSNVYAEPQTEISKKERCPVCGMFVHKYPTWLAQVQFEDGSTFFFDGVKDMLAFYFEPEKYGAQGSIKQIYVTDYYSQKWIDGVEAFYVTGSDVLGPMGHEFVPMATMEAAKSFLADHQGKAIKSFAEIDLDLVNEMRSGMPTMKMKKMDKK